MRKKTGLFIAAALLVAVGFIIWLFSCERQAIKSPLTGNIPKATTSSAPEASALTPSNSAIKTALDSQATKEENPPSIPAPPSEPKQTTAEPEKTAAPLPEAPPPPNNRTEQDQNLAAALNLKQPASSPALEQMQTYSQPELELFARIQRKTKASPPASVKDIIQSCRDGKPYEAVLAETKQKFSDNLMVRLIVQQWLREQYKAQSRAPGK